MQKYNIEAYKIDDNFDNTEILTSIKKIMIEANAHGVEEFTSTIWNWQYKHLPSKEAYVVLAKNELGNIVGYYHIPIYIGFVNKEEKKFAMVQSVAVSQSERGQGLFKQIAIKATEFISNEAFSLAYTFPNNKSIHTFLKYNKYENLGGFKTFIFPINFTPLIKSKLKIGAIASLVSFPLNAVLKIKQQFYNYKKTVVSLDFTAEVEKLYEAYLERFCVYTKRNIAFLEWRFNKKEGGNYLKFALKNSAGTIEAFCVIKLDKLFETNVAIIMDFAYIEENNFIELIRLLSKSQTQFFGRAVAVFFIAFQNKKFLEKSKRGFIKIPDAMNPRVVNLLVKKINAENDDVLIKENWLSTLADWDVF